MQQKKSISEKDIAEWKRLKKELPEKPVVHNWSETASSLNSVYLNECYSGIEEQEDIVKQIKQIMKKEPSLPSPPSWTPSLSPITSEASYEQVIQYIKECRIENKPMKHVIGVVFKTEKEVNQFCSLLDAEQLNYRSVEKKQSVRNIINFKF